jgi:hypothetical protein
MPYFLLEWVYFYDTFCAGREDYTSRMMIMNELEKILKEAILP